MNTGLKEKTQEEGGSRFAERLWRGLKRTRAMLFPDHRVPVRGGQVPDRQLLDDLEDRLLQADVGVAATAAIMNALASRLTAEGGDAQSWQKHLHHVMAEILAPIDKPLVIPENGVRPFVILMAGVNGAGKTTSIGKLAHYYQARGGRVMLAAGDTFRAAAIEQLQSWGERNRVPVIAQQSGADSAAVIYDALQSARARGTDILIADTAGRLHTQGNLMQELKKVRRVITRFDADIQIECLLVIDAGTGQNALSQARKFNEAIGITGLLLAKLDGTAKGGIVFALARETGIPVRFVGVGEKIDDLQVFNHEAFLAALLESSS